MKSRSYFLIALISIPFVGFSQESTEVFLFDLETKNDSVLLSNKVNISNNEGYDNQPSFYDDNTILVSSSRNGQTDIASYSISQSHSKWISDTPNGSEYSPLKINSADAVSAIRLDTDGLQRLYQYELKTGKSKVLLKELKVGYHVWYSNDIIVSTVLIEDRMDLVVSNLKDNTNYTFQKNVGRSLHKIPNTNSISYISKENGSSIVKSMNPISGETKELVTLLGQSEDVCWTKDGILVTAYDTALLTFRPEGDKEWKRAFIFEDTEIHGISRIAISPDGKHLALVSKDAPAKIIQKQVESFNARDLEEFVGCYAKDVVVLNFPADTLYTGRNKMRENYRKYYEANPLARVKVVSRISIGLSVIDHEIVSMGDQQNEQVALYETDDLIKSKIFIRDKKVDFNPEFIVQRQLDAYNIRDIEGFLSTYSENIEIYNYPHELRSTGLPSIREDYAKFFAATPDLHCEIKNRIKIGNKIIDEEYITMNGKSFRAVAIYEVVEGKIEKVTFLR